MPKQKFISGKGNGKWQSDSTLSNYRVKRNKARKAARKARAANRG